MAKRSLLSRCPSYYSNDARSRKHQVYESSRCDLRSSGKLRGV